MHQHLQSKLTVENCRNELSRDPVLGALAFRLRPGEESGLAHVLHHGSWPSHGAPVFRMAAWHGFFLGHVETLGF